MGKVHEAHVRIAARKFVLAKKRLEDLGAEVTDYVISAKGPYMQIEVAGIDLRDPRRRVWFTTTK